MSKQSTTSLFLAGIVVFLGFLAASSFSLAINRSRDHSNRTDRRQRARNSTPTPYHPSCPVVVCPEISAECRIVEHLIMEFDDVRSGQVISCQSCNYCLDPPSLSSRSRQRRDLLDIILSNALRANSATVSCPTVPASCSDVRMTRTWVGGQSTARRSVTHCPVCFDETLSIHRHRRSSSSEASSARRPLSLL